MRLLELFSGTGSICKELPGEVISVDKQGSPTHKTCILEWDYKIYPSDHFVFVWASPHVSNIPAPEPLPKPKCDLEGADKLVLRAMEIIN